MTDVKLNKGDCFFTETHGMKNPADDFVMKFILLLWGTSLFREMHVN